MDVSTAGRMGSEAVGFDVFARLEEVELTSAAHGQIGSVRATPNARTVPGEWTLQGRIGAEHPGDGKDINLRVTRELSDAAAGQRISGWIGSQLDGFGVEARVMPGEVSGELGLPPLRRDVLVRLEGDNWRGMYGNVRVQATQEGNILKGRLGAPHPFNGKDFKLILNHMDAAMALLLVACTYRCLAERDEEPVDSPRWPF